MDATVAWSAVTCSTGPHDTPDPSWQPQGGHKDWLSPPAPCFCTLSLGLEYRQLQLTGGWLAMSSPAQHLHAHPQLSFALLLRQKNSN